VIFPVEGGFCPGGGLPVEGFFWHGAGLHYRKWPFWEAKMTENGDFLSQTAFFRAIAIETGPLDIKCDSGQDQCTQMIVTARPSNNAPAPTATFSRQRLF